mgnify:CR=1 FL=1
MSDRYQRHRKIEDEVAREHRRHTSDSKRRIGRADVVLLVLLVIIAAAAMLGKQASPRSEVHREGRRVVLQTLSNAYARNEVGANATYKGQILNVAGYVVRVGESAFSTTVYVTLSATREGGAEVHCSFPASARAEVGRLVKGSYLNVQGRCNGKVLSNIALDKCSFLYSTP